MARRRILIVDDNAALRENLTEILEVEGFDASAAPDGPSALAALERDPRPDVVLLDLLLPGMDGKQVAGAIRADPRNAKVRIVLMTGLPPGPQTRKTLPVDAVLPKPFGIGKLVATLEAACGERAA